MKQNYWLVQDTDKLKTSEILNLCRELFNVYSYYDDKQLDRDFPPVISMNWFKANIEADEDLENKSANDLEKEGIKGITLRERLLLEIQYFTMTGEHLDIKKITLCSGSRRSDGSVPGVNWHSDDSEVSVDWYYSGNADEDLRSRQQFPNLLFSKLDTLKLDNLELVKFLSNIFNLK